MGITSPTPAPAADHPSPAPRPPSENEKQSLNKEDALSSSGASHSPPSLSKGEKGAPAVPDALSNDLAVPVSAADTLTGTTEVELVKGQPVIRNGMDVSRFIVSIRDDDDPAVTFRGMLLGTAFTAFASIISMLYVFKPYQSQVSPVFLILLIWLFGKAWEKLTPSASRFPSGWPRRIAHFLNLGQPFRIKEHVVASLIASSGNNGLAGVEIYAIERLFYDRIVSASTAVLGTFSLALCGFVLAGVMRAIVVYPAEAVYWTTLPQVVLYQQLHFDTHANQDRLRKFAAFFSAFFVWEWLPAYMMPWLSGVSIPCLASQHASPERRKILTTIFGGANSNEGLGLLNFTFDWQYVTSSAATLPLKQQVNAWAGIGIWWLVLPILYYTNAYGAGNLPIMSTSLFDASTGKRFNVTRFFGIQPVIDTAKLHEAGPLPQLTIATIWGYFGQTLAIGALIAHTLLFFGKDILKAVKSARDKTQPDPHYQAMLKYKDVPMWWYGVVFVLAFVAGIIVNAVGDTTLPVWAYLIALLVGAVIAPFSMVLYSMFGNGIGTNALFKMLAGALVPGRPLANLYFTAWGHQVVLLAVNLANWLKVGQYTKISHRTMFFTQIYASLLGAAFNYIAMDWITTSQREILIDPIGNNIWSGQVVQSMNTQAITWALAKEYYSTSGPYYLVPLGLLFGACAPVLHWCAIKMWPKLRDVPIVTPVVFSSMTLYYVGATSLVGTTIAVGVVCQVWLRRRHPAIYNKYNYLVGAAADGGTQTVIFVLSFAVYGVGGKYIPFPTWWGNPDPNVVNPDYCI